MSATMSTERLALYIAGPMRGLPEFNFPAFHLADRWLRRWFPEATIFNPARRDELAGFQPAGLTGTEDLSKLRLDLRSTMAQDMAWIAQTATDVVLLPGWEASKGATAEKALADALGIRSWMLTIPEPAMRAALDAGPWPTTENDSMSDGKAGQ